MTGLSSRTRQILYRGRPALISFLGVHAAVLALCAALIEFGVKWRAVVVSPWLEPLGVALPSRWLDFPVGRALVLPLAAFGIYKVLWQLRARYEFTPTSITIETGVLWRRTGHCTADELAGVEHRKGPFESLADAGELVLAYRDGRTVVVPGVPELGRVAVALQRALELPTGAMAWSPPGLTRTPTHAYEAAGYRRATLLGTSSSGAASFVAVMVALVAVPIGIAAWLDLPILHQLVDMVHELRGGR